MRGEKYMRRTDTQVQGRITPACAGKSLLQRTFLHGKRDHPRMRGEKKLAQYYIDGRIGSPPHARGKAAKHPLDKRRVGITLACAGKSYPSVFVYLSIRDHPRMRGEK